MRATWTGLLLLAALATASAWWLSSVTREPSPATARGPDWYFDDALLVATGADGAARYRLHAQRIVHDPADGSARVDTVRMEWLQGDMPPLLIHSAGATVSADGSRVLLDGGVRIADESEAGPVALLTETLAVDTGEHAAWTADAVTVSAPDGTLTAIGLFADARTGRIRLENEVRGRYVR